eukprot:7981420-Pyramimonas_sp.AAC.1
MMSDMNNLMHESDIENLAGDELNHDLPAKPEQNHDGDYIEEQKPSWRQGRGRGGRKQGVPAQEY